jgi:hypothetical protein
MMLAASRRAVQVLHRSATLIVPPVLSRRKVVSYSSHNVLGRTCSLSITDTKLFESPFIYMTGNTAVISLSPVEIENLGAYLRKGGFLFAEDIAHSPSDKPDETPTAARVGTPFDRQFKDIIKKALGSC